MSSSNDDELVAAGSAPRWVRWTAWALVGVLAAVLLGVLVSRQHAAPNARPNAPPAATVPRSAATAGEPQFPTGVAQADNVLWEVRGASLDVETVDGPRHFAPVITLPPPFTAPSSETRLAVDPIRNEAWLVLASSRPSLMIEVSLTLARIVRWVRWASPVFGAAAYAGHLYLSTERGIADLAPHAAHPRLVPGLSWPHHPHVRRPDVLSAHRR